MNTDNLMVAGRKFRSRADFEAALRDYKKIEDIKKHVDFHKKTEVLKLYGELQSGQYSFESIVGNDFDDEIYDLAEHFKTSPRQESTKIKKIKARTKEKKPRETAKKPRETINKSKAAVPKPVTLGSYDADMQKEIIAVLKQRERRRKFLVACSSLLAIGCFAYFGVYYFFAERTTADYEQLTALKSSKSVEGIPQNNVAVHKTGDLEMPDILEEYKILYNKNKKLIGWLKIDDTIINYPVMQTANNEYYLDHNFNQEYDKNGSIFLDMDSNVYPRSTNLIIYGHHMKSGKMFGQLQNYAKESYYKDHPIIQFDTIYEKGTYEIIYAFRSKVFNENEIVFKYYQFINAYSEEEFNSNMNEMSKISLYNTGVTASYGDQLLTLSTCDNSQEDGRFVVVAKRIS